MYFFSKKESHSSLKMCLWQLVVKPRCETAEFVKVVAYFIQEGPSAPGLLTGPSAPGSLT